MLLHQGREALSFWLGQPVPAAAAAAMAAALSTALAARG